MAVTTTAINACDVKVELETDVQYALADISGSSNQVSMRYTNNTGEPVRTFGSKYPVRKACGRDASVSLRVVYSENEAEAMGVLKDWYFNHNEDHRQIRVALPDGNPGSDRYSMDVLIQDMDIPVEAGNAGPILVTANLVLTGDVSWAEVGS